jgi:hypothetical protein
MSNLAKYKPEIWDLELNPIFHKSGVTMQCVNRKYEGKIKNAGDTVKIRSRAENAILVNDYDGEIQTQSLSDSSQNLLIDQQKYFSFLVDDIDKAQTDIDVMKEYSDEARIAVDLVKDTAILSLHTSITETNTIGTTGSPIALTKNNIYTYMGQLVTKLKNSGAAQKGKKVQIIINPDIADILCNAPEFTQPIPSAEKVLKEGLITRIRGAEILECTNFEASDSKYYIMGLTSDAITFASQIVKTRMMETEKSFAEKFEGLYVYGLKMVQPKAAAKIIATI